MALLRFVVTGALAFTLACGFWEAATRRFVFLRGPDHLVQGLGHMRPAGWEVRDTEGWARAYFDADGYRGGQPAQRPAKVVLTLGDSYVEALQMSDEQTLSKLTEAGLKAKGIDVWVANPSTSGGDPARYVYVAPWYKEHLKPDRVVIVLNLGDFTDDLLNPSAEFHLEGNPYHLVGPIATATDGALAKIPSSLARLAAQRIKTMRSPDAKAAPEKKVDFKGLAVWTADNLKAAYGDPIIVYIPMIHYFDDQRPHEVERDLADACKRDGLTYIDMRGAFLSHFKDTGEACHGFSNTTPGEGHANAAGHALVADELVKILEKSL